MKKHATNFLAQNKSLMSITSQHLSLTALPELCISKHKRIRQIKVVTLLTRIDPTKLIDYLTPNTQIHALLDLSATHSMNAIPDPLQSLRAEVWGCGWVLKHKPRAHVWGWLLAGAYMHSTQMGPQRSLSHTVLLTFFVGGGRMSLCSVSCPGTHT